MNAFDTFLGRLISVAAPCRHWLTEVVHWFRAIQERHRSAAAIREARGITLLNEWLSPEQQAQFAISRSFDVVGSHTGKKYRISLGRGANVKEIDDTGRPVIGWCFVPFGDLVPGDVVLAQKVALETDEWGALAVAKRISVHIPSQNPNA
jgi:hypothetical protein